MHIIQERIEKMKSKHTFVVLAYKESEFLENCIKSVLNQEYPSEVVIATTTPNKHISKLAKKYKLEIFTREHTSIGGDFDFAISCGKTPLVTVAHQDDFYEPEYSAKIVEAYEKEGRKAQIIFSDYYEIREDKKVFSNTNLKIKRVLLAPLKIRAFSGFKWAKRFVLRFGNAISCPAVTFNTTRIKLPVFECNMACDVDWHAWEVLSKKTGKFVFVNEKLMGHRIHEESETSNTISDDRRSREDFEIYQRFWPKWLAKKFTKVYKNSEKSNSL